MAITLNGSASDIRTQLGLGTAATLNVGTGANNAVQLDGSGNLPAIDASLITSIGGTEKLRAIHYDAGSSPFDSNSTSDYTVMQTPQITPVDTNSKFIVICHDQILISGANLTAYGQIKRDTTDVSGAIRNESSMANFRWPWTMVTHDAPGTTSSFRYILRWWHQTTSCTTYHSHGSSVRTITAYEYDGS